MSEYLDIICDNLDELRLSECDLAKRRVLELRELAEHTASELLRYLNDGLSVYDGLSVIKDGIRFDNGAEDREERLGILSNLSLPTDSFDRIIFSNLLLSSLNKLGKKITESDFLEGTLGGERFTYVRNAFSDEAYDVFSQDYFDPRVRYSKSQKECERLLLDDEVDYCILPLEERGGVRLHSTTDFIFRNDFKINSVTSVFGFDSSQDLKYALISKRFTVPPLAPDTDRYLELRLSQDKSDSLFSLLYAIRHLGMSVYRINTLTFDIEGNESSYFSVVVRDEGKEYTPLFTYLGLFEDECDAVGVYKNLE